MLSSVIRLIPWKWAVNNFQSVVKTVIPLQVYRSLIVLKENNSCTILHTVIGESCISDVQTKSCKFYSSKFVSRISIKNSASYSKRNWNYIILSVRNWYPTSIQWGQVAIRNKFHVVQQRHSGLKYSVRLNIYSTATAGSTWITFYRYCVQFKVAYVSSIYYITLRTFIFVDLSLKNFNVVKNVYEVE